MTVKAQAIRNKTEGIDMNDLEKKNKVLSQLEIGEIIWLYKSGESLEHIAYKVNTDVWNVRGVLRKNNLSKTPKE